MSICAQSFAVSAPTCIQADTRNSNPARAHYQLIDKRREHVRSAVRELPVREVLEPLRQTREKVWVVNVHVEELQLHLLDLPVSELRFQRKQCEAEASVPLVDVREGEGREELRQNVLRGEFALDVFGRLDLQRFDAVLRHRG